MSRPSPAFARRALVAILVLAAFLRIVYFVGLVGGDPQDDGVYYGSAFSLYKDGPQYLDLYKNLPADQPANPIAAFHLRPMVTYPTAAAFALFGPGEISAILWPFLLSLAGVFVVYRLGTLLHDRSVGLLAALLCAFYPLEVINATRILSDVQVGVLSATALLLFFEARSRNSVTLLVWSGVAAGGAYLANGRGLIFLVALLGCALTETFTATRRASRFAPAWVALGFLCVFAIEGLVYYVHTGDPLLSYRVQSGAAQFKYLYEPVTSVDWGPVRISYTNGEPFEQLRNVLQMNNRGTNQFGLFFVLFFAATIFSFLRRRNALLVALVVGLCLYLEFGPVTLAIDGPERQLHYMMVFKQERFLTMVTAPFLILSADALRALGRRSALTATAVIVVLFVTALNAISETRQFYRGGLSDLRLASGYVRGHQDRNFFGDLWAIETLKIFTRHDAQNLRVLDAQTPPDAVRGGCVMLGGGRGVELLSGYVEAALPPFARAVLASGQAPSDWTLIQEVHGPRGPLRLHDFRLYCVSAPASSNPAGA